jgi:hypothetical protein
MKVAKVTVRATAQRLARGFRTVVADFKAIGDVWEAALIGTSQIVRVPYTGEDADFMADTGRI